jgi:ABC-2 type transport system ATP-binding protein
MLAIEAHSLGKTFRRWGRPPFAAVADLHLEVTQGEIFGFLGPNGAGKTTTISMLLGLVHPTTGVARLLGRAPGDPESRRSVGYLPEKFQFHDFLRADEFLRMHAALAGLAPSEGRRRAAETLELVGLSGRGESRVREFSKGMQQRLGIAQALIAEPELVVFDEPTSALDPIGRRDVRAIIQSLKTRGATVLLNSHLLSEVEMCCDRVAIVSGGRVVREGTLEELRAARDVVHITLEAPSEPAVRALRGIGEVVEAADGTLTVSLAKSSTPADAAAAVVQAGGRLASLQPERVSLEDVFIATVEGK